MKFAEINRKFTETVAEWIGKGYTINTATMSGSQGEIAKIDLTNGSEIIRVLLKGAGHPITVINDRYYSFDIVELTVGRVTDSVNPNSPDTWATVWNNNLEIISSEEFYEIGRNRHEKWYGTKEEAIAQQDKNWERHEARTVSERTELLLLGAAIVLPFVKRQPKCKSVRLGEIDRVTKTVSKNMFDDGYSVRYTVEARGNTYRLH